MDVKLPFRDTNRAVISRIQKWVAMINNISSGESVSSGEAVSSGRMEAASICTLPKVSTVASMRSTRDEHISKSEDRDLVLRWSAAVCV